MSLTTKQRKQLIKASHHITPIFQVGKEGVKDNLISQVIDALEKREIIKLSVLQNSPEDNTTVAEVLARETDSHIVMTIGNTLVLYKESRSNKQLELL